LKTTVPGRKQSTSPTSYVGLPHILLKQFYVLAVEVYSHDVTLPIDRATPVRTRARAVNRVETGENASWEMTDFDP